MLQFNVWSKDSSSQLFLSFIEEKRHTANTAFVCQQYSSNFFGADNFDTIVERVGGGSSVNVTRFAAFQDVAPSDIVKTKDSSIPGRKSRKLFYEDINNDNKLAFKIKEPEELLGNKQMIDLIVCFFIIIFGKTKQFFIPLFWHQILRAVHYYKNSWNIPTKYCFKTYWSWNNTTLFLLFSNVWQRWRNAIREYFSWR